jgi:asparagine synthase (glutamine-hydrolysing)
MCGITGFFKLNEMDVSVAESILKPMNDSLIHRGPDASSIFSDLDSNLLMGHRRLSILDTSSGGLQPMHSHSENLVIAFNGEIYNHNELRCELEKQDDTIRWNSSSDTETLLEAFEQWGIEDTLTKLRGMFAIALWDKTEKNFYLIRDRFGEKPLYYGWVEDGQNTIFSFGSELKALRKYPNFSNKISQQALLQYFSYMYVPCPLSIYDGIFKLEPGCILKISSQPPKCKMDEIPHPISGQVFLHESLSINRWYDFKEVVNSAAQNLFTDYDEASSALEAELEKVITMQSLSDVPLGAFLSGGVDSSAIVALMQKQSKKPIKTFTIGFEDPDFDESTFASEVASHLKTDHSELLVTAEDAQSIIPDLPHFYDEPFADYSQIPTYFVCKSAKQAVTVSLSGDAGDELFGGYNRYLMAPRLWSKFSKVPSFFRKIVGMILLAIPIKFWDLISHQYNKITNQQNNFVHFGEKVHRFAARLRFINSEDDLFSSLISEPSADQIVLIDEAGSQIDRKNAKFLTDSLPTYGVNDLASKMMYLDTLNYLTDDILCKVDRAAMSNSLETRVPFLDHKIVELAWRMPLEMKINHSEGKSILRNILYKHVPKKLIERPKAGFSIPLGDWLKGPLKEWAEVLLESSRIEKEGYLNSSYVNQLWVEHLAGKRDGTFKIWSILMFQSWLESTK